MDEKAPTDRTGTAAAPKRPPTSADVARLAGVSRSTVSLVLNEVPGSRIPEATRLRVLDAVRTLGYAPNAQARQLRAGASRLVLMPLSDFPLSPVVDSLIEDLSDRLQGIGVTLLVHGDRKARGMTGARLWAELRPAAVLVSPERCTKASVALLRQSGTEVLLIADRPTTLADTLVFDQRWVGAEAAAHLLATGHRRLAALVPTGPLNALARSRAVGLRQAAEAAGATAEEIPVDETPEGAARAAAQLTRAGGPTGLFTYNDEFGALVHAALSDLGLHFPQDLALVGADDLPIARYLRPPLSSVRFDPVEAAEQIFRHLAVLLGRLPAQDDVSPRELVRPHLVRRATS